MVGSALRAAGALVAARFGMVLAALVATIVVLVIGTSLLGAGAAVPVALRQAFVASPVLVFVRPNAARSDVEAIGPGLMALPDVSTATLRPKEEALATLVAAGIPAPTDGRNPLPDVWTVTLHGDGPSFVTEAVAMRDAISALALVDSVRFDEAWARSLDRTAAMWSRFGAGWLAGSIAALGLVLFCAYVLFGRALTTPDPGQMPTVAAAVVIVAVCLVIVAAAVSYAACLLIGDQVTEIDAAGMKPIAVVVRFTIGKAIGEASVGCLLLLLAGVAVGHRSDRPRQSR